MSKLEVSAFTPEIKKHCRNRCGLFGEPACFELPDYIGTQEQIEPCDECKRLAKEQEA